MKESIFVQNLKCGGCAKTITSKLTQLNGISHVAVVLEKSEVIVEVENEGLLNELKSTLAAIGYPPLGEKNSLLSQAKSVVSCATGKLKSE